MLCDFLSFDFMNVVILVLFSIFKKTNFFEVKFSCEFVGLVSYLKFACLRICVI